MQHFLLAVNRIAAFWWHSAIMHHGIISSRGSTGRASPLNPSVVGSSLTWNKNFSIVCAHFGLHGRCGTILSRLRLRGQLQYRSALRRPGTIFMCLNKQEFRINWVWINQSKMHIYIYIYRYINIYTYTYKVQAYTHAQTHSRPQHNVHLYNVQNIMIKY